MGAINGLVALSFLFCCIYFAQSQSCLHDKGLVKVELLPSDILKNYNKTCDEEKKNFPNVLLGYITTFNPEGKNVSLKFAKKFDIITPVWYAVTLAEGQYWVCEPPYSLDQRQWQQ